MNQEGKALRIGAAVILCAVVLKLYFLGIFQPVFNKLGSAQAVSLALYLQTGRIVRPPEPERPEFSPSSPSVPPLPEPKVPEKPEIPVFTQEDAENVEIIYEIDSRPDIGALMTQPLSWNLYGEKPKVLIVHTHGTESYQKQEGDDYAESSVCRTLDENYNMIRVGTELARQLEEAGLSVLHDTTIHDYPSYSGSYENCRETVESYLEEYPSIQLVLDLHRDAADDGYGGQYASRIEVNGEDTAQLMIVVGSNGTGLEHPEWRENLAAGLKLQTMLERCQPGICRKLDLCAQRFNQHLRPGMLLVEVGYAGNTLDEALRAVHILGESIVNLGRGANLPGES